MSAQSGKQRRTGGLLFPALVAVGAQACFDFGGYELTDAGVASDGSGADRTANPEGGVEAAVLACDDSCSGCCDGETCVPISVQTSARCGQAGVACTPCSTGFMCGAGACVVDEGTCTNVNCFHGCCAADYCVAEQDWYACGTGGTACATCGAGSLCTASGVCDEAHWSPNASLRLRMGVVEVACGDCDYLSGPDPYVCFTARGTTLCSANCVDSSSCDYGSPGHSNPWTIENFVPSDFTSGESTFAIWDDDPEGDNVICSGTLWFPSPLEKTTGAYWLDASACKYNEGSIESGWFMLEAM